MSFLASSASWQVAAGEARLLTVGLSPKLEDGKIDSFREELAQVRRSPPNRILMCVASILHIPGAWHAHPPALVN